MRTRVGISLVLVVVGLGFVAGCGDDDTDDATDATEVSSPPTTVSDEAGADDAAFCDTLEAIGDVNDESVGAIDETTTWDEISVALQDAADEISQIGAEAEGTVPPEVEDAFADLIDFAELQGEVAADSGSEEAFSDALAASPDIDRLDQAVTEIDEYASDHCGVSITGG